MLSSGTTWLASVLLSAALAMACQPQGNTTSSQSATALNQTSDSVHPSQVIAEPAPLNLGLSMEFLEQPAEPFLDERSAVASSTDERFKPQLSESRLQLDGKLYTQSSPDNTLPSIEGGEISLQLKFE